jgi:hypothetical protein
MPAENLDTWCIRNRSSLGAWWAWWMEPAAILLQVLDSLVFLESS